MIGKQHKIDKINKKILRGHDDEVTCVVMSTDLDVCISGSKDHTIIIHTLTYAHYIRSIEYPSNQVPNKLALSQQGNHSD